MGLLLGLTYNYSVINSTLEYLTSFHTSITDPVITIKIPIELVSHDLLKTVDTGGRYGLLTLENKFGASGY